MKLNLCCGANLFPDWRNVDKTDVEEQYIRHLRDAPDGFVWPEPQRELAAHVKAGKPLEFIRHDVRQGLARWATGSVDAIYIGQAIEHFNRRTEAPALLKECLRVLKPGASIRLTTPCLDKLVSAFVLERSLGDFASEQPAFYASGLPEDQLSYLLYGASGADSTNENYEGHHHCYTERSLGALLTECGFTEAGDDWHAAIFMTCRDFGMSHSFAIEAVKP